MEINSVKGNQPIRNILPFTSDSENRFSVQNSAFDENQGDEQRPK